MFSIPTASTERPKELRVVRECCHRTTDHAVAVVRSFRHQFVENSSVLRESWSASGASRKVDLPHCAVNGRAGVEDEVVPSLAVLPSRRRALLSLARFRGDQAHRSLRGLTLRCSGEAGRGRSAPWKFAPSRLAPVKSAPVRRAPRKFAPRFPRSHFLRSSRLGRSHLAK
jgi:hypothetical protein